MQGKWLFLRAVFVCCCVIFGTIEVANAERPRPYRTLLSLSGIEHALRTPRSRAELDSIPSVRVKGRVYGSGGIDMRFSHRRNKTWRSVITRNGREEEDSTNPVLLRGTVSLGGGLRRYGKRVVPTAAYMSGDTLNISFVGRPKGARKSRQRVYTIRMKVDGTIIVQASVSSIPRSAVRRGGCASAVGGGVAVAQGVADVPMVKPVEVAPDSGATETARVVTLSTDADPEWYARYGDASNTVIAGLINAGEAIYARQLGIRFRIVKQHVYADTSPYTSTEPVRLLNSFALNESNPSNLSDNPRSFSQEVDLKHLFTGKDMDGPVIGIAYIGVLCASPTLSYGVTSHYVDAADFAIFAHELGHNFGAGHDTENQGTLMYPSISVPPSDSFSADSLKEVNEHLYDNGACLSVEQVVPRPDITPGFPTPTPPGGPDLNTAIIRIKKARVGSSASPVVRLSGRVVSAETAPLPNVTIRLFAAGEVVGDATTDEKGEFKFFLRLELPKDRQIYLWVETLQGEVYSNFVWLGSTQPR